MDKQTLRKEMLRMRKALPPQFVLEAGRLTGSFIASLSMFSQAQTVMLYCDFQNEMGTAPLITYALKKKKQLVLPLTDDTFEIKPYYVTSEEQLTVSKIGIREPNPALCEPCDPSEIDLILVPGVAFDISGARIGFGKGCYDHLLPLLRHTVPIIGFAYDFQVLPQIPSDPHDVPMDAIVTEKGILQVSKARNEVK